MWKGGEWEGQGGRKKVEEWYEIGVRGGTSGEGRGRQGGGAGSRGASIRLKCGIKGSGGGGGEARGRAQREDRGATIPQEAEDASATVARWKTQRRHQLGGGDENAVGHHGNGPKEVELETRCEEAAMETRVQARHPRDASL
ncbi:uncharacterized protein [Penaeus vannamei]|uniref:uncharacterized protein n=1 Tax=Penaeus vannamei TaxID=6689 RepID=UPI00387F486D